MATEHPTDNKALGSPAVGGDRRSTAAAQFPSRADIGRLTARAREELTGGRFAAESARTIASCPACAAAVRSGDDYVRHRGDLYHAKCMLYRQRGD